MQQPPPSSHSLPGVLIPWTKLSSKARELNMCQLPSLWFMFHKVQLKANKYFNKTNDHVMHINVTELRKLLNSLQLQRSRREGQEKISWFIPSWALPRSLLAPLCFPLILFHVSPQIFSLILSQFSYFPYIDFWNRKKNNMNENPCTLPSRGKPGHWTINISPCPSQTPSHPHPRVSNTSGAAEIFSLCKQRQGTVARNW